MTGWKKHKIDDIADLCLGKMLDDKKNRGEPLPYLANVNVRWGEFDLTDLREMRFESHELDRYGLRDGDIVMCEGGEPGRCAIWKSGMPGMMIQKALHRIRPHDGIDPHFLYYSLLQKGRMNGFAALFTGSTIKHLPKQMLELVEIMVPPLSIQTSIASILSAYDDLIENNRRRIALLEETARLLYREWFVRLRFPGHENTRIVNGVPEGWHNVILKDLVCVSHGCAFKGEHFSDDPTSRVLTTPGNFRIGGGIKADKLKFYQEDAPLDSHYVLEQMDLILTMTDLSKDSDTLGLPAFVPKFDGLTFLHNQRVGKVVPISEWFPKNYLFCLFCDDRYRHHVVGAATGTSVKHTSPSRILSYAATMPKNTELIDSFESSVEPCFEQINLLLEVNKKLRAARDLLLPKLMSGEIEV